VIILNKRVMIFNNRQYTAIVGEKDDHSEFIASIDFGKILAEGFGLTIPDAITDLELKCRELDKQYNGRVPY